MERAAGRIAELDFLLISSSPDGDLLGDDDNLSMQALKHFDKTQRPKLPPDDDPLEMLLLLYILAVIIFYL